VSVVRVLRVELEPPVAWDMLDRPDGGNPIDDELIHALVEVWNALARDAKVSAIGSAALGPVFSIGVPTDHPPIGGDFGPKSCGCELPVLIELAGDISAGAFQLLGEADVVLAAPDVRFNAPMNPVQRLDVLDLRPRLAEPQPRRPALLGPFEPLGADGAAQLGLIDELVPAADLHPVRSRGCARSPKSEPIR
jgi:enoyl-CoA hydratase/carnithine racemase